jgi:hypothetical protein
MQFKVYFKSNDKKHFLSEFLSNKMNYSFYILFGSREYNIELTKYHVKYKELLGSYGILKIKNEDLETCQFIFDMFEEYQICGLIGSENPEISSCYDYLRLLNMKLQGRLLLFKGFEISELNDDYFLLDSASPVVV